MTRPVPAGASVPDLSVTGIEYAPAPESTDIVHLKDRYDLWIGGRWVAPVDGGRMATVNPATEEPLAEFAVGGAADVDAAVAAARSAFDERWALLLPSERAKYLYRIARILQ
ncbi:MAG: aldehyde dehydrogenase family protein, partial [Acidimicrobiales bacterium]|nr:aldehyde dehydrogenase family protein [Acidimicrobiales bacterium]